MRSLAQQPLILRQINDRRAREEIIELAAIHARLVSITNELRSLGCAFSAYHVAADARFIAGAVCRRAYTLGFELATVAQTADCARSELGAFGAVGTVGTNVEQPNGRATDRA